MVVARFLLMLLLTPLIAFALEYKTGYKTQSVLSFTGYWDGQWNVRLVKLQLYRKPEGMTSKPEELFNQRGYTNLPDVPPQTSGQLKNNSSLAFEFNSLLPDLARELLSAYSQDGKDKVSFDLEIKGTDGQSVHYVATYDGDNGYRSYGFQNSAPNLAFFEYVSSKIDVGNLPPPPSQIVSSDYQNSMGKYSEVVYRPDGTKLYERLYVDVAGRYDPPDEGNQDAGLQLFINEVVKPELNRWNAKTGIVNYYYNVRLALDENGNYRYTIDIPYRETQACNDGKGSWNEDRKRCEYNPKDLTGGGQFLRIVRDYWTPFSVIKGGGSGLIYITRQVFDKTFRYYGTLHDMIVQQMFDSNLLSLKTIKSGKGNYIYIYINKSIRSFDYIRTLTPSTHVLKEGYYCPYLCTFFFDLDTGKAYISGILGNFLIKKRGNVLYQRKVVNVGSRFASYTYTWIPISTYYPLVALFKKNISCYGGYCKVASGNALGEAYRLISGYIDCWRIFTRKSDGLYLYVRPGCGGGLFEVYYAVPLECPEGYAFDSRNGVCYKEADFKYLKETIRYNYETEADYKMVSVSDAGTVVTVGLGRIRGSQFAYTINKKVDFPALYDGRSYTPASLADLEPLIISFLENDDSLVNLYDAGLTEKQVAPITVVNSP